MTNNNIINNVNQYLFTNCSKKKSRIVTFYEFIYASIYFFFYNYFYCMNRLVIMLYLIHFHLHSFGLLKYLTLTCTKTHMAKSTYSTFNADTRRTLNKD